MDGHETSAWLQLDDSEVASWRVLVWSNEAKLL